MLSIDIRLLVFLRNGMVSLDLICRFAQQTLLHALRVLYFRVYKGPQLVLQLFDIDLLLNLH